ncbi:MAG TPA: CPXCG motif-containing cysteine-rich protein [Terriglobales bacterium]
MVSGYVCAGCGPRNETTVDESAGSRRRYVEDCQICRKPNALRVSWDAGVGEFVIDAELE